MQIAQAAHLCLHKKHFVIGAKTTLSRRLPIPIHASLQFHSSSVNETAVNGFTWDTSVPELPKSADGSLFSLSRSPAMTSAGILSRNPVSAFVTQACVAHQ
jgi:hypothetical protein